MATPVPLALLNLGFNAGTMGLRATGDVEGGQSKDNEDQWGAPILFRPVFVYRDGWKLVSCDF